jgi:hypothetical protein
MISKEIKIAKVEKSWKFEGYCFVTLTSKIGYSYKRKCYERKTGPFKNRILINLDCDIYSFIWDSTGTTATDIKWVGNYKTLEEAEKAEKVIPEVEEEKVAVEEPVYVESDEVFHDKYTQILTCVSANIPVYLAGPAGSGKNHTLEQVASSLDLDFYFTNSVQQEYKITGFIDAGGNYHETEFYKAFTKGGLFFLDEMDASIPEVLVLLNAAIANRYFEFPNGKVTAHKDFRVVAAGNTVGSGANDMYTGRLVLDQATLDRFVIIDFDYCLKIELHLVKGNTELVDFIHELRKQATDKGIRATFSYRCMTMVTKLEDKMELVEVLRISVFKGMDKDTIKTFNTFGKNNKYFTALNQLKVA